MSNRKKVEGRKVFLAKMQDSLTEIRNKLVLEIADQLRTERDANRDDCMDTCDLASEENDREMNTRLSEREQLRLGQIDDALRRVAALSYGLCETCGLDVSAERLNAMPFTRLCCDCQQEREREAKARRRYEKQDSEGDKFGSLRAPEMSGRDPSTSGGNGSVMGVLRGESGHRQD